MKRIFLLVLCLLFSVSLFSLPSTTKKAHAQNNNDGAIYFDFCENGKHINFDSFAICKNQNELLRWGRNCGHAEIYKTAQKIQSMGFSYYTTLQFLFPGMNDIFDALEQKINKPAQNRDIFLQKNGQFKIIDEIYGKKILREETAKEILKQLEFSNSININIVTKRINPEQDNINLINFTNKKSQFSTWCGNSSAERKNNISLALDAINCTKIESGKTFSFNNATGPRNESAGYKKAKIIQNGTFTEGFGGGVCQVSTTLYNAAVLAGLEILEVHPHSLPVSYVAASRDAMVSGQSADLIFKNNSQGPIFIKANFENEERIKIEILGEKNQFKYEILSEITQIIPNSYGKNGCESVAYLIKKDLNGNLISKTKIREDYYAPSQNNF